MVSSRDSTNSRRPKRKPCRRSSARPKYREGPSMKRSHFCLAAALLAFALALAGAAHGQAWPSKPIRWIVGFPPGGGADVLSRMLSPKISEALGQQIIIDNRGGAGGNIGA